MDIKFRVWDKSNKRWCRDSFTMRIDGELSVSHPECYIMEQYTGLKDKNDVEIYIGDIVRMNDTVFLIENIRGTSALVNAKGEFEDYMCNICDMCGAAYEVIGNIYENKDKYLLNKGLEDGA